MKNDEYPEMYALMARATERDLKCVNELLQLVQRIDDVQKNILSAADHDNRWLVAGLEGYKSYALELIADMYKAW
jgi:hypothetical protein